MIWTSTWELSVLTERLILQCYFMKNSHTVSTQLHGFSDACEAAYSGVIYLWMINTTGKIHVALVISKVPLKCLTIPPLELSGANLLATMSKMCLRFHLLECSHVQTAPSSFAGWRTVIHVNLRTFVGNRVSTIIDFISPKQWRHVPGDQNLADPASRGLHPSELWNCELWWNGSEWLSKDDSEWSDMPRLSCKSKPDEVKVVSLLVSFTTQPVLSIANKYSSFVRPTRVTAWMLHFLYNVRKRCQTKDRLSHCWRVAGSRMILGCCSTDVCI